MSTPETRGLTRKGPTRVWRNYKTLRVPEEIFEDVRNYMHRKKLEYRAQKEGLKLEELDKAEDTVLENKTRKIIEKIMAEQGLTTRPSFHQSMDVYDETQDMTARDIIERHLKNNVNKEFSNTQISRILQIPGPTVREATRTLAQENPSFQLRTGRPNKIMYWE